jgi:hypothetical protein
MSLNATITALLINTRVAQRQASGGDPNPQRALASIDAGHGSAIEKGVRDSSERMVLS